MELCSHLESEQIETNTRIAINQEVFGLQIVVEL